MVMKEQRIRDPVHGLIVFSGAEKFEQLIWSLVNSCEFQRLRRIKQLGFSELVYPGATHTRFSHSVGVFYTARELVGLLQRVMALDFSQESANTAICAALLHDLGHGPFSHTFEGVEKARGLPKKHEKWTTEIILGDTDVGRILADYDKNMQGQVAELLGQEYPSDIYSSIVSSQFDADRVDYLRRDKLMTGTEHGGFDWAWLLNNLEIEKLTIGGDDEKDPFEVEGLVLGSKGLKAAEGYLLGRFHLYTQVYMHKTTRGAEKMLEALLSRVAKLIAADEGEKTGLPEKHPLRMYFGAAENTLASYLSLDDTTIWGCLPLLELSEDGTVSELARRLRNRKLYKCFDVGAHSEIIGSDVTGRFRKLLGDARTDGRFGESDILQDRATVSAYKFRDYESPDALTKVTIRIPDGSGRHEDVAKLSPVVGALNEEKIFRVYARTPELMTAITEIWNEATR